MTPGTDESGEDWFARFEREAREAAERRDAEATPVEPASPVQPAAPYPPAPQVPNPFDAAPAPEPAEPAETQAMPAAEPAETHAMPAAEPAETHAMPAAEPAETQAMQRWEPEPTQALDRVEPAPTEALAAGADAADEGTGVHPAETGSALDSLFGDDRFREYAPGPDPSESPFAARSRSKELVPVSTGGGAEPPPPRQFGTVQKALLGAGGGLLAVLALIALFLLGTRLPDVLGPAPAVVTPSATPSPTVTALPIGPVDPGVYAWDELLGGECLDPYVDAWQEEYTVVPCDEPHPAQMVYRAWFPEEQAAGAFPGEDELAAQMVALCSAPGVLDLAVAGQYADTQVQGAYPVSAEQWEEDPSYYCFVSRESGEPIVGSVAVPQQPAEPEPAAEG